MKIKLHYIWFEDYSVFKNMGINLSSKYAFNYDSSKEIIQYRENKKYIENFYGENIDLTAVVGYNGVGKTSLVRFILNLSNGNIINTPCLLVYEIVKNNRSEWLCIIYKKRKSQTLNAKTLTSKTLQIQGLCNINLDWYQLQELENNRVPYGDNIRYIYLTNLFSSAQFRTVFAGADDLSFAHLLYECSTDSVNESYITNPVTKYIHMITDYRINVLSNGAKYIECSC